MRLYRILSGHAHEGLWKRQGSAIHRYLTVVHCFEQCRLRLWGGPLPFVRQQKVCEDRRRFELERFRMRVIDWDAYNVARKHIRGELEPMKFTLNGLGYGMS